MTIKQLQSTILTPFFTTEQVKRLFPDESMQTINMQLKRWVDKQEIIRLKRGLFIFPNKRLDEFFIANLLYPQSYVSLESALNAYGILPDIPAQVTSVTPMTSKQISTVKGNFLYSKIDQRLYFGYKQTETHSNLHYQIAEPEKALLDYIYIRQVKNLEANRIDLQDINRSRLQELMQVFPSWVQEVINSAYE